MERHVYPFSKGDMIFCSLEQSAHTIFAAMPKFVQQLSAQYSQGNTQSVCTAFQEKHNRSMTKSTVQNVTDWVGSIACNQEEKASTRKTITQFAKMHLAIEQIVHIGELNALNCLMDSQHPAAKVTPPDMASEWIPRANIAINNFKTFTLGTHQSLSGKYIQKYLDEYTY